MLEFMLLFSRQGDVRLQKWYVARSYSEKKKITRDLTTTILARKPQMCAFLDYGDKKILRLAVFLLIEQADNELLCLELIRRYVELLDDYFVNVCELDIHEHFEKAYFILDEFLLAGEVQETSRKRVLQAVRAQDLIQEEDTEQSLFEDNGI
ncbi:AP complex subunit sigma [Aphelenchoides fujianensis]|nr:AP complex subunit sigma [Aphelenchoides fujianensis]